MKTRWLKTRPTWGVRLDLLVCVDEVRIAVELKYLVAGFTGVVAGEKYELPSQAAQDIGRHDAVKDVVRLERLVAPLGEMNRAKPGCGAWPCHGGRF